MLLPQIQKGLEAGTDEAGRGCLAGPVTAAAVLLPQGYQLPKLNDSKKISAKLREALRVQIEMDALSFAVVHVPAEEIDQLNILNASILAMHRALEELTISPEFIAVDGNRFHPYKNIPHQCVIKGDGKYQNIAAASILAKTYRDAYMLELHHDFPAYAWNQNKGYPTKAHRKSIAQHGATIHHRKSFQLLPKQLVLNL
jgi:ribonuclease HII